MSKKRTTVYIENPKELFVYCAENGMSLTTYVNGLIKQDKKRSVFKREIKPPVVVRKGDWRISYSANVPQNHNEVVTKENIDFSKLLD